MGSANLLCLSWVPPLSSNEVALATPTRSIPASLSVSVRCLTLIVMPEREEVSIVRACLVRALLKARVGAGWLFGEDASNGRRGNEEVGKGDHFVRWVRMKGSRGLAGTFYQRSWMKMSCLYTRLRTGPG